MRELPDNWRHCMLGDLSKIVRGSSPRPAGDPRYFNGDYLPWITVADVTSTGGMYLDKTRSQLTAEGANHTRILEEQTLILANSGATLGVPKIMRIRGGANDGIAAFLSITDASKEFLFFFLESQTRFFRERLAPGVGQPNLNTELIGSVEIALPPEEEQVRIAEVLAIWNKRIEKTEAVITAKAKFERGLLQQLLTGKRRFQEFVKYEGSHLTKFGIVPNDWPYVHIGDIAREISEKNTYGKALMVLSCTKHRGLVDSLAYFGKRVFSEDTSSYKVVRRGQFAYATNHIEEGSIGYQDQYDEALISPMYTVFQTNDQVVDAYLYKLLKTELYRHIFEVNTSASVNRRGSLRWEQFAKIKVALPSLGEQHRIAAALDVCENEIELLKKQLDALKRQKRGLVQKLLTGQIRLQVGCDETKQELIGA